MLIQNAASSTVPAPRVVNDGGGMPVASTPESSAPVETPKVSVANAQPAPAQPTPAQVKDAVDMLNKAMRQINSALEFSIDNETKATVVRVIDSSTGITIKQFPSEEALAITRAVDKMQGMLLRQKA